MSKNCFRGSIVGSLDMFLVFLESSLLLLQLIQQLIVAQSGCLGYQFRLSCLFSFKAFYLLLIAYQYYLVLIRYYSISLISYQLILVLIQLIKPLAVLTLSQYYFRFSGLFSAYNSFRIAYLVAFRFQIAYQVSISFQQFISLFS